MPGRRRIVAIPVDNPFSSRKIFGPPCRVHGVGMRETTGTTAAIVQLHNGEGTADPTVLPFSFAANESIREWFGESGIWFDDGVFFEVISGTVTGCIYVSELAADVFAETDIGRAVMGVE